MKEGKTGVTAQTPSKVLFGAGTIHRGLKYTQTVSGMLCTVVEKVEGSTNTYSVDNASKVKVGMRIDVFNSSDVFIADASDRVVKAVSGNQITLSGLPISSGMINGGYDFCVAGSKPADEYKETAAWNFRESLVGATSGGSTLSIVPEYVHVEADGALVKVKGLEVKTGEAVKLDVNLLELTEEIIKAAAVAKEGTSADSNYTLLESKAAIEEGDYWENIAFVGKTLEGKNIIVILDNALCTSGLELGGENKKESVGKYTFESHADLTSDLDTLPYHIYYPKAA